MPGNETKYVDYIKKNFPQLRIGNIKFNVTDGMHCDIVIINEELLFKFSKYDWTVAFLSNQVKATGLIRNYVDMALPHMEYLEDGIAKCEFIPGDPLYRNEILLLNESDQNHLAKQIGVFLRQLHAIPLKPVTKSHLPEVPLDLSRDAVLAQFEDIKRKVYPYCDSYTQTYIERIFEPVLENENFLVHTPCLIHADLTPRRFIHDKRTKKINGVIGFGCSGIGDPAYDFGMLLEGFGETFVRRIGKYYGNLSDLIDRARFYACFRQIGQAKKSVDMIATRDFSNFRFQVTANDCMPVGCKWQ